MIYPIGTSFIIQQSGGGRQEIGFRSWGFGVLGFWGFSSISPVPHFPTSPLPHFPTSPLPHFPTSLTAQIKFCIKNLLILLLCAIHLRIKTG
ncbi:MULTISPECIES: hypothetical protein [unclassified Microcystis]|uniref:hypothetical protein n=1 Tax=unclassified Microcystis TaxID=2643300 RepID=UPI0018AD27DC